MTGNEADRRVQRTRRLLQDACIELILEKGYDAVTVQDILDRADVGRSTFYAHYRDKEDLVGARFESLHAAFEEHLKYVINSAPAGQGPPEAQVNLPLFALRYIEHEHQLAKALLGKRSGGARLNYVRDLFLKYTRSILKNFARAELAPYELEAIAEYTSNSILTLTLWWVDSDMPCPVEEICALMMRLMEPGMKDVLGVEFVWSLPEESS